MDKMLKLSDGDFKTTIKNKLKSPIGRDEQSSWADDDNYKESKRHSKKERIGYQ